MFSLAIIEVMCMYTPHLNVATIRVPAYEGHHRQQLTSFLHTYDDSVLIDITHNREYVIGQAVFAYDEKLFGGIAIMSQGKFFSSVTSMFDHYSGMIERDDRKQSNVVVGNSDQWGNLIVHETGEPLIVAIGVKTLDQVTGYNPNQTTFCSKKSFTKSTANIAKTDDRWMSRNGKGVWHDPNYFATKIATKIDFETGKNWTYKRFVEYYGKEMVWHDLHCLTANEFEMRYGL